MKRICTIIMIVLMTAALFAQPPKVRQLKRQPMKDGNQHQQMEHCQENAGCDRKGMHQAGPMMLLEKLELNEKQKTDIEKLIFNHRLEMTGLDAEIKRLMLMRQKYQSEADFANVRKTNQEYFAKRAEMTNKRVELDENIYKVLDRKQQEEYRKLQHRPFKGRQKSCK